ncbi:MAG: hypothetical protein WC707_01475 [Candidatus Babeliaceae bacterium]
MKKIIIIATSMLLLAPQVQASYMTRATRLAPAYAQIQRAAMRPGVTLPVQQSVVPQRSFFGFGGPSQWETKFPTKKELAARKELEEAQKLSLKKREELKALGFQHRNILAANRAAERLPFMESPGFGDVTTEEPFVMPTAQEVKAALIRALWKDDALKIMEYAEYAMIYILNGDMTSKDAADLKDVAERNLKIARQFRELDEAAAMGMGGGHGLFASGMLYSHGITSGLGSVAFGALTAIGFYNAFLAIRKAVFKNDEVAILEFLEVLARAEELLAEKTPEVKILVEELPKVNTKQKSEEALKAFHDSVKEWDASIRDLGEEERKAAEKALDEELFKVAKRNISPTHWKPSKALDDLD